MSIVIKSLLQICGQTMCFCALDVVRCFHDQCVESGFEPCWDTTWLICLQRVGAWQKVQKAGSLPNFVFFLELLNAHGSETVNNMFGIKKCVHH
jgi:hypothetical protein